MSAEGPEPAPRSLRRSFAAMVLVGELLVVGFASLVAVQLSDVDGATLAWVAGGAAVLCVLAAGSLRSPAGYALGWLVQLLLVLGGFWVPMMFGVGLVFAGLWYAALRYGGRADAITARRFQQH
ncbi:hypothetical protein GCM10027446_03320 [Angustibacter peucedani]